MNDLPSSRTVHAGPPDERARRGAFAKSYPFAQPAHSFIFAGGAALAVVELTGGDIEAASVRVRGETMRVADYCRTVGLAPADPLAARIPVIAHGSNAAPERLVQKFGRRAEGAVIPVLRATLESFDVVYAPHFSSYGSIPATLEASPDTAVEIALTYLTSAQLAAMDATEIRAVGPTYARGRLAKIRCHAEGQGTLGEAQVYLAKRGSLQFEGSPRAFAALRAARRRFDVRSQEEKQASARDRLAPGTALDDFIHDNVCDNALRTRRGEALAEWAVPLSYDHFEIIEG